MRGLFIEVIPYVNIVIAKPATKPKIVSCVLKHHTFTHSNKKSTKDTPLV